MKREKGEEKEIYQIAYSIVLLIGKES